MAAIQFPPSSIAYPRADTRAWVRSRDEVRWEFCLTLLPIGQGRWVRRVEVA
jgi:hypothetical protein